MHNLHQGAPFFLLIHPKLAKVHPNLAKVLQKIYKIIQGMRENSKPVTLKSTQLRADGVRAYLSTLTPPVVHLALCTFPSSNRSPRNGYKTPAPQLSTPRHAPSPPPSTCFAHGSNIVFWCTRVKTDPRHRYGRVAFETHKKSTKQTKEDDTFSAVHGS